MLYILHKRNHQDLNYTEGQRPIVHLQADLGAVVAWADREQRQWAYSDRNAGSFLANFYTGRDGLGEINWKAVESTDFRDMAVKEGKQAEFLVHGAFPWRLIERIGVCDEDVADKVRQAIAQAEHQPAVAVERNWYY